MLRTLSDVVAHYGLTVRAGGEGLDRPLRWVHVCELASPGPWLRGGELVLTTGLGLPADDEGLAGYVGELTGAGAAGLGFAVGPSHPAVPAALVDAARAAGLPVLELPADLAFQDLTYLVGGAVLRARAAEAHRLSSAYAALAHAAAVGGGARIVTTVADLVDGWAVVVERSGATRWATGGARLHVQDAVAAARLDRRRVRHPDVSVHRVGTGTVPSAHLVVGHRPGQESYLREVGEHAATLLHLTSPPPAVTDALVHARRQAVDTLLEEPAEALARTARRWGLPVDDLVVTRLRSRSRSVLVEEEAARWAEQVGPNVLVAADGPVVTAVLPADLLPAWRTALRAAADGGTPVRCGVGGPAGLDRLARSAAQATRALQVAVADGQVVVDYDGLPTTRLLLMGVGQGTLAAQALAGLETAGPQAAVLVESLQVFLAENGSWEAAAAQLGVHRHTLRQRVRRIEDLTGRDLSSFEDRVTLWIALRARDTQG